MSTTLKQALKELGEARKIIRASSSRQLAKDWDRRATAVLADLRAAIQQATQPAEVTDFDLQKLWLERFKGPSHDPVVNYARAILAMRPVQAPMNQDEVIAAIKAANISSSTTFWSIFEAGIRAAEAHQGITAQAKKETP